MISAFAPLCPGFSPLLRQFVRTRCSSLGIASVRPPAPSGRREGKCTAFPNSLGCSSPVRILSGTCRSSRRTPIFRLGQGSAKFAAVPEQFKNSSFTCGHSSPLSPDSLFSIPRGGRQNVSDTKGKRKPARSALVSLCRAVSVSLWPSLPVGERNDREPDSSHGEPRIARVFWRISPESFCYPYFVNEPQTRGALHALTRAAKRCPLSERLMRYI